MSSENELEKQFALLSKKVDEQFRFTRTVIVLCTLVNLGLLIFTILATFQSLPSQVNAHYMSNLEPVVRLWRQYEALLTSQEQRSVPPVTESPQSDAPDSSAR